MTSYQPLDPEFTFPAAGTVTCGLRTDLPRKQRRHDYRDAGPDIRHQFDGTFVLAQVAICITCGKDIDEPVPPAAEVRKTLEARYGADMVSDELVALTLAALIGEEA